jgi:hypothetical protein
VFSQFCQGVAVEAVAFLKAVRDIRFHVPPEALQPFDQQRGSADAVNVEVAVYCHFFAAEKGFLDALDGFFYIGHQPGVAGQPAVGVEKGFGGYGV